MSEFEGQPNPADQFPEKKKRTTEEDIDFGIAEMNKALDNVQKGMAIEETCNAENRHEKMAEVHAQVAQAEAHIKAAGKAECLKGLKKKHKKISNVYGE
jgi:hypothetical protein